MIYTDEPVGEELIALFLAVAVSASSKSDFQQLSIIRLKDPQKRGKIAAHFPLMPWIGTSPVFLVFCADARRLERICTIRNHPRHNGDLEAFLNASVDAALAMRSEEHTSELQSHLNLVCRLLLEKKKKRQRAQ